MLHVVLSDLAGGTAAMAGHSAGASAQQGFVQVVAAINAYGEFFEHPGFQPIRTGH
jgi:hypothetical protein